MPRGSESYKQIKLTDKGYKSLVKRVFDVGKPTITVGIHAKEGAESKLVEVHDPEQSEIFGVDVTKKQATDVTLADVAEWMEFGTPHVPSRSYLRAWFDKNQEQAKQMLVSVMRSVVRGTRTKEQALELLGLKFVGEIQDRISRGIPPPLAASTIKAKGSSVPLIATGQLRSGVTHQVHDG